MMKKIIVGIILLLVLAGCRQEPEIVDNGNPGSIKVIVFQDENSNKEIDSGESGVSDSVGISQEDDCPPSDTEKIIRSETDSNGETVFSDLKPGIYCTMYLGNGDATSRITYKIYLSSDQEARVTFGLSKE